MAVAEGVLGVVGGGEFLAVVLDLLLTGAGEELVRVLEVGEEQGVVRGGRGWGRGRGGCKGRFIRGAGGLLLGF